MPRVAKNRGGSPTRQMRREEIEAAALRSVVKHGFPGSSLRVVAREAGVPLSILHYYFRDKDELMRRAVERMFEATMQELGAVRSRERDPVRRVEALLEAYTVLTTDHWRASLAFIEYWAACVRRGVVDRFYRRVLSGYRELLAEALQEAGAAEPGTLGLVLLAMMAGYSMLYNTKAPDPAERAEFIRHARAMVGRAVIKGRNRVRLVEGGQNGPSE